MSGFNITPFPPLNDDGRAPGNGFELPIGDGGPAIPTGSPMWGIPLSATVKDVRDPSYTQSMESHAFAIVPSDTAPLAVKASRLQLGTAGDVKILTDLGQTLTLHTLAAGVVHKFPFAITQVFATGTAATNIVGME